MRSRHDWIALALIATLLGVLVSLGVVVVVSAVLVGLTEQWL